MEHTPADQSEEASWKARLNRLNHDLAKSEFAQTLNVNDFKTFDAALRNLFVAYSKSPLQRLATSLEPHFDHVRSFHVALSATIQQSAVASSIWSASLAVIECTCRHVSYMEETFESLARFYQTFPMFTRYINLFSSSPSLRLCHVVQNLFSSASRRSLKSILKRWDDQTTAFEEHAKLAFRERTYFTGRALFLSELHETLSRNAFGNPAEPRSCLIHAMGGMGKTQSALAYGFQFERYYDYRFWIRSETPDLLTDSFASVATILGINTTAPNCFNFVKEWMENTDSSWLVIFDNVEKETISAVESLLPSHVSSSRPSAIILTSQFEQHKHIVRHSIALKSLSTEESVQLLLKCLRHDPQEVSNDDQRLLEEVSELLGGFPMGVAHVGGYISESKHSLRSFRDFFRTRWQERVWEEDSVISQHDKRLGIIWDLALDELPPKARKLIHIMAYLNPDVIPEDWIENDIAKNPDWGEDENLK
ncbi:transcriptional xre family [Colletotrichum kahawae]|uniref:Transcriptional xre family n=1 Tax=Colletotrichum kahawae TaxID=34407 RepID=A0AAE0CXL2_COLKA|nr:transcriptional xre family [Colletotrichum kahawae]